MFYAVYNSIKNKRNTNTQTNKPTKNPHGSTETPKTDVRGRIRIVESIACRPYLLCNFHPSATPTKDRPRKDATAQPQKQQKPTQQTAQKTTKNYQGQTSRSSRENAKLEWLSESNLAEFLISSCNYHICIISLHPLAGKTSFYSYSQPPGWKDMFVHQLPTPFILDGRIRFFQFSHPPGWEDLFSSSSDPLARKIYLSNLPTPLGWVCLGFP